VNDEIKRMMQNRVIRDAELVLNRKLEDSEKKEYLENPELVQDQMKKDLMGAPSKLVNAYNDLAERSRDLQKLENVRYYNFRI
jgi:hypothetical protein